MTVDSSIWSTLVDLNKVADSLIARARKRIEPSPPVSRELLTTASIEARFNNLKPDYTWFDPGVQDPLSDALWGNNVKRGIWTNGGSRLYLRNLAFDWYFVNPFDNSRLYSPGQGVEETPPYFLWNLQTSITQKQYADKRVSMRAGGRREAGNQLSFKDPLVIEPMETLTFEVELLSYGSTNTPELDIFSYVVALYLSGYREGM